MYSKTMTTTKSTTCGRCGEHTDYATWNVLDDEWQCPRCAGKNLDDLKDDDDEDADSEDDETEDSDPDFVTEKYSYMLTSTMKTSRTILVPGDHVSADVVEALEDEFGTQDGHLKCPEELNDEDEVTLSQVADVAGIEVDEDDETGEADDGSEDVEEPTYTVRVRTTTGSWGQEIETWHVVPDERAILMDDDKAECHADVEDALASNHKGELVLDDETIEQVERGDELTAPELLALVNGEGDGVETDGGYEGRLGTSQADDVEEFVPADAEPLFDSDSLPPTYSPIYVTDDALYNTDVHCRRCYCDVSRTDRESGEVTCPNCGWSSADIDRSWQERAEEISEQGGVGWRQAQVVALIEDGRTHAEVAEELDLSDRSEVSTHVSRYRDDRDKTEWLAEYGPEI